MQDLLERIWAGGRWGLLGATALAGLAGLVSAWVMPRGPVTPAGAVATMGLALVVGLLSGLAMGSRWSLLVAPAAFWVAMELGRIGAVGPTVERLRLGSTYGIIALVTGRLWHALLAVTPMMLGAACGARLAGLLDRQETPSGLVGWALIGFFTVGLALLAFSVGQPGRTHPIMGPSGEPVPGSVAEIVRVPIGGRMQTIMIRGRSAENPVLLHLAGGPGGTDLGAMRADVGLEERFLVAVWDQRGTGKSYSALDPVDTLTLEQMVADALEVSDYLQERFGQDKIYLMGNSWGTLLGVLAVQRSPERFHAYIGTGQMVSIRETDVLFYEDTLAWAERNDSRELVAKLQEMGPPPYDDLLNYAAVISPEHAWNPYPYLDTRREMPFNLFVPENGLMDRVNGLRGLLDTFSALYPQLQKLDLRRDATRLEVPIYMVMGRYEARGRALPAETWFAALEAPYKERVVFERSGHRPSFEEPAAFAALMERVARASR